MRVNLVIRGEEWLPSVPMHLQLFAALGFEPPEYAHTSQLMKQIPGGKRKLSKRKDPETNVDFYIEAGYPAKAVLYYLRGLANGSLAELPLDEALAAPIRLAELGGAGPLVDQVKLEDISADHIATLPNAEILAAMRTWAASYDPELASVLETERDLALAALAVERDGAANPRKDLRKWSDFRSAYGFFFPELFTLVRIGDERLAATRAARPPAGRPGPRVRRRLRGRLPGHRRPAGVVRPDQGARGQARLRPAPSSTSRRRMITRARSRTLPI